MTRADALPYRHLLTSFVTHSSSQVRFALRAREEAAKVPRPDVEDGSVLQMRVGEWVDPQEAQRLNLVTIGDVRFISYLQ